MNTTRDDIQPPRVLFESTHASDDSDGIEAAQSLPLPTSGTFMQSQSRAEVTPAPAPVAKARHRIISLVKINQIINITMGI